MAEQRVSAEVNWPFVVGLVVVGGVVFYALYGIEQLLSSIENATLGPLADLENGIGSFLNLINPANWFSSNNALNGGD